MPAYAVKHLAYERGPLSRIMKQVKAQPYSLTSKEPEASDAVGNYVFVIEVRRDRGATSYWLGYKYRVADKVRPAGGGKWESEFDFKNIGHYPPDGLYLDVPVEIADPDVRDWLSTKQPGMAEIPASLVAKLDTFLVHGGRAFV